jgi:hypothetical protein
MRKEIVHQSGFTSTDIDNSGSARNRGTFKESYQRGCQEKILLLPLRAETDGGLRPAPPQFWRGCGLAAYSGQTGQLTVGIRWFHEAMVIRRLRFWKLRKQTRWLVGQPWS